VKVESAESAKKSPLPKKMWVQVKATGDVVEIDVEQVRPVCQHEFFFLLFVAHCAASKTPQGDPRRSDVAFCFMLT
jgi:hypothetical protein